MDIGKKIRTIESAINRLQAMHERDHEVMDADDEGDLLSTMLSLREMRSELDQLVVEIHTPYSEEYDQTFIMEDTYINGELKATECIGWYCGEPNAEDTAKYGNREMRATY